jgi:demethoxyubiquinone hydroxylase (CLK1/Coq7/Cat5 family)
MKRHTVILPFLLPCLTDKAAMQLVALLHELSAGIEHHYAEQIHRHHKHQQEIRQHKKSQPPRFTDPPF